MKRTLLLLAIISTFSFITNATVWTVDNNPNSPGQYTSITDAHNNAQPGDTILIAGSLTSYGSLTISKPLTIIGSGMNNPYGVVTELSSISIQHSYYIDMSGTKLSGLEMSTLTINSYPDPAIPTDSILIERCHFNSYMRLSGSNAIINDIDINNCYFETELSFHGYGTFNNINITNCIFNSAEVNKYSSGTTANLSDVTLRNSIFLDNPTTSFSYITGLTIDNNIFYMAEPAGCTQCTFNHNVTYGNTNDTIPYGTGLGLNNLINVDPMFVNYPSTGGAFDWSHNFHLQSGSTLINGGTDSSDIGLYGGAYPYEFGSNPAIPQMIEVNYLNGSSIPMGGTLNINFKAKKQD